MAVDAVKPALVAASLIPQVAFSPVASLDSAMAADNLVLLLLQHQLYIRGNHVLC